LANIDVNTIVAQAVAQAQAGNPSTSAQDQPIVPLWLVRPPKPVQPRAGTAGSANAAEHNFPGSGAGSANAAERAMADAANNDPTSTAVTMAAAEGHWMEMSQEDRLKFADMAQKAGVWKPSLGADALFQAWGKAVGWAGKYNSLHQDEKDKWMSPFEAVTNMQIAGMADDGQSHDGFSTESTIRQFTMNDIRMQAKSILQNELGRNPTDSEMKAYTAAVNAASRANPQITTTQGVVNPDGSRTSNSVVTGGINSDTSAAIIQDAAQGTQESADYKTAAMYMPALMQALGSAIHM
jgi:hypothetical protein